MKRMARDEAVQNWVKRDYTKQIDFKRKNHATFFENIFFLFLHIFQKIIDRSFLHPFPFFGGSNAIFCTLWSFMGLKMQNPWGFAAWLGFHCSQPDWRFSLMYKYFFT
ncbi:MAG: hypothetical protein RR472_04885 [Anaerovoracaceae bacterium]